MPKFLWMSMALLMMGCATQNGGLSERDRIMLEGRIDDLEAAQLRHKTKIAALEKRVSQLDETISLLSRRTSSASREVVKIEPDASSVSSNYQKVLPAEQDDDVYQEIIIGEDKKRTYFGSSPKTNAPAGSGPRKAYDNVVTNDRLPSSSNRDASADTNTVASPMTFYQEGIDYYRQGNFVEARARFEKFLATKPDTSYVDNALYWIGECYYGEGLYHEAASFFHKIIQEYPNENKVPDALLKVSLTYQKLGKLDSAREMLRYLMEAYPGTEAARIGKEKYETLQ